jgi:hypothetical protein
MAELGENHKRRILVTFQHVDKLLEKSICAIARLTSDLKQDVSAEKLLSIQNHIEMIRDQMSRYLKRFGIVMPERDNASSWILKTSMTSIGIALDDLAPNKLKGYGNMDSEAARELTQTLREIHKVVNKIVKTLE